MSRPADKPQPPAGYDSWVTWCVRPEAFWPVDGVNAAGERALSEACLLELAALRQRAENMEIALRFHARENCEVAPPSADGHPYWLFIEWGTASDDPEGKCGLFNTFRLEVPDDGTGLPLLNDEARAALAQPERR